MDPFRNHKQKLPDHLPLEFGVCLTRPAPSSVGTGAGKQGFRDLEFQTRGYTWLKSLID